MSIFGPYPCRLLSIHDGDTMTLALDLGFDLTFKVNCRVFGINAPELSTPEGKAALAYAGSLIEASRPVSVVSHGWDKYGGRFDGSIQLADGRDFGQLMLDGGHAVPFMVR